MQTVRLIAHTPNPEQVVAAAARLCYSAAGVDALLEAQTPEKNARFVRMLASMGHESPIEHVSFTFAIEGVSRSLLAQITRHRLASYSVQSQRYVRMDDFHFVIPPEIARNPAAKERFLAAMRQQAADYLALVERLQAQATAELTAQGMDEASAARQAEKKANEDARFVLPNACETKLIVTMNARSLKHFFQLRCCNRAQWEIRALAEKMFRLVYPIAPALFADAGPSCASCGQCSEGKMSCGKAREVRAKYDAWKAELCGADA